MALYVTTWTLLHLQALEAAIATGAQEVYYGDKKVKYNSLSDMLLLRDVMISALYPPEPAGVGFGRRRRVASFDRAL